MPVPDHLVTLTRREFNRMRAIASDYTILKAKLDRQEDFNRKAAVIRKAEPVIICLKDGYTDLDSAIRGGTGEIMGGIIRRGTRKLVDSIIEQNLMHVELTRIDHEHRVEIEMSVGIIKNLGDI